MSANIFGAHSRDRTRLPRESAMHASLRSITRGRARGPPPALTEQLGLGRKFWGTFASWPAGPRGRPSGSGAASGHPYQRGLAGGELETSAAAWLHAEPRAAGGLRAAVSSRRFLGERILVPPDWPPLPWSGLLIAVKAFARVSDTPAHQRQRSSVRREMAAASAVSRLSQARLNQQMNDRSPSTC